MTMSPDRFQDLLDGYLDGRLAPRELDEFESLIKDDPARRQQLRDAQAVDEGLREMFSPPEVEELVPDEMRPPAPIPFHIPTLPEKSPGSEVSDGTPVSRAGSPAYRRPLYLAAAAVLAIAAAAGVYVMMMQGGTPPGPPQSAAASSKLTPALLYANLMKKKFRPQFKCDNDQQFASFLGDRFGTGAVLAQASGVEVLGWDYADGMLGEATAVIMARVDGKAVVLVVDQEKYDKTLEEPGGELSMFRETCNRLVFYEITPIGVAKLLPLVRAAPPMILPSD
jgi:hypothetical protein